MVAVPGFSQAEAGQLHPVSLPTVFRLDDIEPEVRESVVMIEGSCDGNQLIIPLQSNQPAGAALMKGCGVMEARVPAFLLYPVKHDLGLVSCQGGDQRVNYHEAVLFLVGAVFS